MPDLAYRSCFQQPLRDAAIGSSAPIRRYAKVVKLKTVNGVACQDHFMERTPTINALLSTHSFRVISRLHMGEPGLAYEWV